MIEKDPASFQKLLDGYFAAGEKLDKKEALRVAEEYLGQDAATLETSLDWISYQDLAISEEAIYLADRVVILDANPGQIKAVLTITLGKHRDRTSEDFLAIRDQIFEIFHMKRKNLKAALFPPLNIIFNRIFPFHMEDLKNRRCIGTD